MPLPTWTRHPEISSKFATYMQLYANKCKKNAIMQKICKIYTQNMHKYAKICKSNCRNLPENMQKIYRICIHFFSYKCTATTRFADHDVCLCPGHGSGDDLLCKFQSNLSYPETEPTTVLADNETCIASVF